MEHYTNYYKVRVAPLYVILSPAPPLQLNITKIPIIILAIEINIILPIVWGLNWHTSIETDLFRTCSRTQNTTLYISYAEENSLF